MPFATRARNDSPAPSGWAQRIAAVAVALLASAAVAIAAAPTAGANVASGGGFTTPAGTVTGQFTADGTGGATASGADANTSGADTTTIALGSTLTLLSMDTLNLAAGDTLNFVVGSSSDVVLLRVDNGVATVGGTITTTVGPGGPVGGNLWIVGPGGVVFGPTAQVSVGGLLATTGVATHPDVFDGNSAVTFVDEPGGPVGGDVVLQTGSQIVGNGGLLAFVAPSVEQQAGSTVSDGSPGQTDVLYGGAGAYTLTTSADGLGLSTFAVVPGGESPRSNPVTVAGTTTAGSIFMASDTSAATGSGPIVTGMTTASGAAASSSGDLVIVSGGGVGHDATGVPVALDAPGSVAEPIVLGGALTAASRFIADATGDLTVLPSSTLSGNPVALDVGGVLTNAGTVASPWAVYADTPADIAGSGLDSMQTAIWGSDRTTHPPASLTGDRYVFTQPATLTFTAVSDEKDVGETATLAYGVTGYQAGLADRYLGDTAATAYTGTPSLDSDGAVATAWQRAAGPYPIDIGLGTVSTAASGYGLAFVDGLLTVHDTTPPSITGLVGGTPGENGWYVSDVSVDWVVADAGSEIVTPGSGCGPVSVTADQPETPYTCSAHSYGGTSSSTVRVARDATAPALAITGVSDGAPYASGSWTDEDVAVDFACSDARSGVDSATERTDGTATVTTTYSETCDDLAGNTSPVTTFQVNIDRIDPTIATLTATKSGGGTYVPGTWSGEDVTVSWTCADDGGSGLVAPGGSVTRSGSVAVVPVCADNAGNSTVGSTVQVLVDKVAPQLQGIPDDVVVHTTRVPVTATWTAPTATDTGSGLATQSCTHQPGAGFERGSTTVTCTATDQVGNVGTAAFSVVVKIVRVTFGSPIDAPAGMNTAKLGRVVPVKITLTVDGRAVTRTSPEPLYLGVPVVMACSTARSYDAVETYTTSRSTGNLFRWNAASSRWLYNLPVTGTASTCYRVPIFYGGEVRNGVGSGGDVIGFFYLQAKK